ncbi:hypothetical protein NQ176_g6642 [Zarea fungicola]|uniref:Uncharacterized protein n=1 Tax=Zarea fungicola TaxID=93591 RepID=A0ACC1N3A3_9HYPO|nr:hypothetical protein NQ176_g6642 [Lecanicillium fungicola]
MKLNTLHLLTACFVGAALGYSNGAKIYAQVSDVDLGHGTTVHEGVKYAFHPQPGEGWYISNSAGADKPHWIYLPGMKGAEAIPTDELAASQADHPGSNLTDSQPVAALDKRQRPPDYLNYYDHPNCLDFDVQNKPVTLNQCVWNRSLVAWSSVFTPAGANCRFITNYYNSGCGLQASCSGYITQTFDFAGCLTPSRPVCSTFSTCCVSGC